MRTLFLSLKLNWIKIWSLFSAAHKIVESSLPDRWHTGLGSAVMRILGVFSSCIPKGKSNWTAHKYMSRVVETKQPHVIAFHPIFPSSRTELKRINVAGQKESAPPAWSRSVISVNVQSCNPFAKRVWAANVFTCSPEYRRRYFRGMWASLRRILKANLRSNVECFFKGASGFQFSALMGFISALREVRKLSSNCARSHWAIILFQI